MNSFELVIFANSRKHQRHCVAGKCFSTLKWIRPVSNIDGEALDDRQITYTNPYGRYPVRPLQRIKMHFQQSAPLPHQPENQLISDQCWEQHYKIDIPTLPRFLDFPDDIWGNGDSISYREIANGHRPISQSLYLIHVDDLQISQKSPRQFRAIFTYNGMKYSLAITDPLINASHVGKQPKQAFLCVSLGENFHGYCYKLVATIFWE